MTDRTAEIVRLQYHGRWGEAAAEWRTVIASIPAGAQESAAARAALVRCLWHDGKNRDAEDELAVALQFVSTTDVEPVVRGRLLLEQGRLQESRGHYRTARTRYSEALGLLTGTDDESAEAMLLTARLARETGETADAEEVLNTMQKMKLTDIEQAELMDERGALEIGQGHFEAAALTLNNALDSMLASTEYQTAHTRLLLAEAYVGLGRIIDAETELTAAAHVFNQLKDHRGQSEVFELFGRIYEAQQEYHRAIKAYHDGLEHDYGSEDAVGQARAYRHLARCYRQLGEVVNAESMLDDAERVVPMEHDVERASLLVEQGHLACDSNDYDGAARRFRSAIELIEPDDDPSRLARAKRGHARALREGSKLMKAREILESTRDGWPLDGDRREFDDLLDDLAEVYLDLDLFEPARDALLESLRIGDEVGSLQSRARTKVLLAQALFSLGDRGEAVSHLNDALSTLENDQTRAANSSLKADALLVQAQFVTADGQVRRAVELLNAALKIATRRGDAVRVARAQRELSACYRIRGALDRAGDYLDAADDELQHVDDRMEKEMLALERARLDIARHQDGDVERRLRGAQSFFIAQGSAVRAATCDRLRARAAFQAFDYERSLELLESARVDLERYKDRHQLDDIYDDIAEVHMQLGRFSQAAEALHRSLDIDKVLQWRSGSAHTMLLQARLALLLSRSGDVTKARQHATRAAESFRELSDDVGGAEALLMLGDCALAEKNWAQAVDLFKQARRMERGNGDRRGMAVCNQRLGHTYLQSGQYERAEEALDQAEDYLENTRVSSELAAPLERDRGQLKIDSGHDHGAAIAHFERALRLYQEIRDADGVNDIYQRLIASHQARKEHDDAFRYMQEMGFRHATMWAMLAKELDPALDRVVADHFAHQAYSSAVSDGYTVLESELRAMAGHRGHGLRPNSDQPDSTIPMSLVLHRWCDQKQDNAPNFGSARQAEIFETFAVAAFEFVRNPRAHHIGEYSAQQAFTTLSIANLVLTIARSVS
jgi:tetratricopeptide (TPR) repeat protein